MWSRNKLHILLQHGTCLLVNLVTVRYIHSIILTYSCRIQEVLYGFHCSMQELLMVEVGRRSSLNNTSPKETRTKSHRNIQMQRKWWALSPYLLRPSHLHQLSRCLVVIDPSGTHLAIITLGRRCLLGAMFSTPLSLPTPWHSSAPPWLPLALSMPGCRPWPSASAATTSTLRPCCCGVQEGVSWPLSPWPCTRCWLQLIIQLQWLSASSFLHLCSGETWELGGSPVGQTRSVLELGYGDFQYGLTYNKYFLLSWYTFGRT